jgi:methyltransferase (TIGR00027 family)
MAFMRAAVTGEKNLAVRSEDRLARHFLGRKYRFLFGISVQAVLRRALEFIVPGSYGFTITRTRHFDEILLSESRTGVEQVVLLGAGYDSRAFRFRDALRAVKVFEIDHPGTQARKLCMLARSKESIPANVTYIPVDFNRQSLREALFDHGFSARRKTLFMWEGVSYYLPRPVVASVLDFVSGCAAGSSIVFDYALAAYVNGETSTPGGRQVARWLKKVREPFVFGLDPAETREFLAARDLHVTSDLGPEDLAQAYLKSSDGGSVGSTFGHIRMVHAGATGAKRTAVPAPEQRKLNDRLRQTFTGGCVVLSPGVLSLVPEAKSRVLDRVRTFASFGPGNDDHEFGSFDLDGVVYCFELERRARAMAGVDDVGGKSTHQLTIMRADEY